MNRFTRSIVSVAVCSAVSGLVVQQITKFSYCDKSSHIAKSSSALDGKPMAKESLVGEKVITDISLVPSFEAEVGATVAVEEEEDDDDEEFEITPEKEECPFCQHFLKSPCAKQFMRWSICVDKCKVDGTDFVTVCENLTTKLLVCTEKNVKYFESTLPKESDSDSSTSSSSSSEHTVAPVVEDSFSGTPTAVAVEANSQKVDELPSEPSASSK